MHGVESSTSGAKTMSATVARHAPSRVHDDGHIAGESAQSDGQGALHMARSTLKEALGATGFVDVTGSQGTNFETFLQREPVEMEMEDLKPGMLIEVASWVSQQLAANPEQALDTQARVRPGIAFRLLVK